MNADYVVSVVVFCQIKMQCWKQLWKLLQWLHQKALLLSKEQKWRWCMPETTLCQIHWSKLCVLFCIIFQHFWCVVIGIFRQHMITDIVHNWVVKCFKVCLLNMIIWCFVHLCMASSVWSSTVRTCCVTQVTLNQSLLQSEDVVKAATAIMNQEKPVFAKL